MPTEPATGKQRAFQIVDDLPEDSSYEDILLELTFERMVERGLADAKAGRTISSEEMKRRMESWGTRPGRGAKASSRGGLDVADHLVQKAPADMQGRDFRQGPEKMEDLAS